MSAYVTLNILMTRPNGTIVTLPATLGTAPFTTPTGEAWAANQYVSYIFVGGDLIFTGTHQVQVLYTDSTQEIPSNMTYFTVYP